MKLFALFFLLPALLWADAGLYQQHCASCHGADRLGGTGPALLPQNLRKLKPKAAAEVIAQGRTATQMPAFQTVLQSEQIQSLVAYIYTPIEPAPQWNMAQIEASRIVHDLPQRDQPKFKADVDNLFVVVELGDHHASLLDGDRFEVIQRFPTRYAVHGGPKWAQGGRYIYFLSRDGWVSQYDVFNLAWKAEIRAGINGRNLAVSDDGRWLIVANYLPHNLVILAADGLKPVKIIPAVDRQGQSSRISAVYTANGRQSFIAALKDSPELWEISYQQPPPKGFGKDWVHDYRYEEKEPEAFPIRRLSLPLSLDDFLVLQDEWVVGSSRQGGTVVIDLDLGRKIAEIDLAGLPHLSSAITWQRGEQRLLATPNIRRPEITVVDMQNWQVIARIPTPGSGFFLRSHEQTPYAWGDVFFGPNKDLIFIIDKDRLKLIKTLKPEPGKVSAHVEFTKDGAYALVSIWDMDGAIVIYDAQTLKEIKRLPMKKPSGKYNVHNKLNRSEGTSH